MGLKKYIGFSLLLIVAVYIYVFSIETSSYTLNVMEYSFSLPVAVWMILPISTLFLATLLHIIFYGFRNYLQTNSMKKDEDNIVALFKELLLENDSNKKFKQKSLKELSEILSLVNITPKDGEMNSSNSEINTILTNIKKIEAGEYVSDKVVKFNKLGSLHEKNLLNRASSDVDYAMDILKKADTFSRETVKAAFKNVVTNKTMTTIKKLLDGLKLDKEMVFQLMEKDSENSEFALDKSIITKYTKEVSFDRNDYIKFAKLYKKSVNPDDLITMFEEVSNDNDQAIDAYLVILFELEMIDKAREVLSSYPDEELLNYRAFLELKDSGKHYTLDNLCK